jgi:hypothetical protein
MFVPYLYFVSVSAAQEAVIISRILVLLECQVLGVDAAEHPEVLPASFAFFVPNNVIVMGTENIKGLFVSLGIVPCKIFTWNKMLIYIAIE